MILLSFIIPVYNCAHLIRRCVESIVSQRISGYEIILVNDGSKDNSLAICKALATKYTSIRVFSHENRGTSSTRNKGLGESNGKYVWFVDADDYIPPGFLPQLWEHLIKNNFEIITFNYLHITQDRQKEVLNYNKEESISTITYLNNAPNMFAATKIYKKDSLGSLIFKDGLKNIEDFLFNIEYLSQHQTVYTLPLIGYVYDNTNDNSTSKNRTLRNLIKVSLDSMVVHCTIMEDLHKIDDNCMKEVIYEQLNYSIAGYFFSLLKYYNPKYLLKIKSIYKDKGLYPIGYIKKSKARIFARIINIEPLLNFITYSYKYLKK